MKSAPSCCRKQKKVSNYKNMSLETGLLKIQTDSLPAGGVFRVIETVVSPVIAVIKAAPLMNATLSDQMKTPSKLFWRQSVLLQRYIHIKHPRHVLILKCVVLMFIQRSQPPQINQCMWNTGNVYRNIGNAFKNHITIIEKIYIGIYIDIQNKRFCLHNICVCTVYIYYIYIYIYIYEMTLCQ